ncbi:MAG: hybrid sensor histidine kinase/response regulator, partial [Aquabacterium sp.]
TLWWTLRLRREVTARRRSDDRLADIGATLPGLAFRSHFASDGTFRSAWYSPGASAFLGMPVDGSQPLLALIGERLLPEDREVLYRAQADSLKLGQRLKVTGRYRHPDGRLRWLHSEVVPKARADGTVTLTGYLVDVTTERELQARVAREADARHLLLASASHELRAPTHALSLALQALAAERSGDDNPHLRVARESSRTLMQLLNEVLDAARLDHDELPLQPQAFSLRTLIDEIVGSNRNWARDKALQFVVSVDPALPRVVQMDPMRLRQVVVNLLSNAIKYTVHGSVRLGVDREGGDAAGLCITVADSGRGIAPDQLASLFTPYTAAGPGPAVAEGSTGLGLSICRRLIERMGGRIEVDSRPGEGTTVQVHLPLAEAEPAAEPGTVLICDDDDTSRLLLAQMLTLKGHAVAQAADGAEALARWRAGDVRAVITDLEMDGMPGTELLRRLRELEGPLPDARRTRLVVCSGSAVPLAGAGAALHDAYMAKPVDIDVLVDTLAAIGVRPAGTPPAHTTRAQGQTT